MLFDYICNFDNKMMAEDNKTRGKRIVRNTLMLYFRMFVLLCIGLFTSRVVLGQLGIDDYGIYNVVGGLVTMFTIVTNSITQAIVRYITFSMGRDDESRLKRVFSTSVVIQAGLSVLVVLLVETLGMWFLKTQMNISPLRMDAASWVLHSSAAVLVLNLLSIPYNATITAHEDMAAYAWISLLEGILKLSVACALYLSGSDKLKVYSVLTVVVALIVRACYAVYCKKLYKEVRGRLSFDSGLVREMSAFAGWNFLGSGVYIANTQGINLLTNVFFGVAVNAARGIAFQVENIVKQLVSGFLTAMNPQITKSYAAGDRDFCFSLVSKGSKYSFIVIWMVALPFLYEAETILQLWLGNVPEDAPLFVRITLLVLMADMTFNPLLTLILAEGHIRGYYLIAGMMTFLAFPLSWVLFRIGMPAFTSYLLLCIACAAVGIFRVFLAGRRCGFPAGRFFRLVLMMLLVAGLTAAFTCPVSLFLPEGFLRLLAVLAASTLSIAVASWFLLLAEGEKSVIKSKLPCR